MLFHVLQPRLHLLTRLIEPATHPADRDIATLAEALDLGEADKKIKLKNKKGRIDRRLGLAILLHWLAFPIRQENDMEEFWQRDRRLINQCVWHA